MEQGFAHDCSENISCYNAGEEKVECVPHQIFWTCKGSFANALLFLRKKKEKYNPSFVFKKSKIMNTFITFFFPDITITSLIYVWKTFIIFLKEF